MSHDNQGQRSEKASDQLREAERPQAHVLEVLRSPEPKFVLGPNLKFLPSTIQRAYWFWKREVRNPTIPQVLNVYGSGGECLHYNDGKTSWVYTPRFKEDNESDFLGYDLAKDFTDTMRSAFNHPLTQHHIMLLESMAREDIPISEILSGNMFKLLKGGKAIPVLISRRRDMILGKYVAGIENTDKGPVAVAELRIGTEWTLKKQCSFPEPLVSYVAATIRYQPRLQSMSGTTNSGISSAAGANSIVRGSGGMEELLEGTEEVFEGTGYTG